MIIKGDIKFILKMIIWDKFLVLCLRCGYLVMFGEVDSFGYKCCMIFY